MSFKGYTGEENDQVTLPEHSCQGALKSDPACASKNDPPKQSIIKGIEVVGSRGIK